MSKRTVLIVATLLVTGWLLSAGFAPPRSQADLALAALSQAAPQGFRLATTKPSLSFPRDHRAHPEFRTEWWYFTGHLETEQQREFGFQFTLFRFAFAPKDEADTLPWQQREAILGHFAISDFDNKRFYQRERLSRAHPELAGYQQQPFKLWLDHWQLEFAEDIKRSTWRFDAREDDFGLRLQLSTQQAPIAQGEAGLSQKSRTPGNSSIYYSQPQLVVKGELYLGNSTKRVRGNAWLDREWSTSALSEDQQGWDWFALRFDNGDSLMFYRLRDLHGKQQAFSAGSYVTREGKKTTLLSDDVITTPTRYWRSPRSGSRYPLDWRLEIPRLAMTVEIKAAFSAQEWLGRFHYWEGAVSAEASQAGKVRKARGYLELTGY